MTGHLGGGVPLFFKFSNVFGLFRLLIFFTLDRPMRYYRILQKASPPLDKLNVCDNPPNETVVVAITRAYGVTLGVKAKANIEICVLNLARF